MTLFRKIGALVVCLTVTGAAVSAWRRYTENVTQEGLARALRINRVRADQGDAQAQYELGKSYAQGKLAVRDYAEAGRWYRKAADQGNAKAQYALAFMYHEGKGVQQDYAEGVRWSRKAAAQGDANAQVSLGVAYSDGKGAPQDDAEAIRWYRAAAELGSARAQYALGFMYSKGRGLPQDDAEAARWYRKAVEGGDVDAQNALAYNHWGREEASLSYTEKIRWYAKTAASCLAKTQSSSRARGTSIVVILAALPVLAIRPNRWGRKTWLSWALCFASCFALLTHELLPSAFYAVLLEQVGVAAPYADFGRVVWIAVLATGSVILALTAVRAAVREFKTSRLRA